MSNPATPKSALVVDDEPGVRMCTVDVLLDMGYEVLEAGTAEQALALIAEGARPQVVITDHLMPGMSGSELAAAVVERLPDSAVILVSGYADVELAQGVSMLPKPFGLRELRQAVETATAQR
jgi:CheY-like chemotaxis protein